VLDFSGSSPPEALCKLGSLDPSSTVSFVKRAVSAQACPLHLNIWGDSGVLRSWYLVLFGGVLL